MISQEQLSRIINRKKYGPKEEDMVAALNVAMKEAEINTPLRVAHFMAQILHETGGFKYFAELGGNAYFMRYEGRSDLGNNKPGDGPRFKGRGFIQVTGRANYTAVGKALGLDLVNNPDLAMDLTVGARIAGWYWRTRSLNDFADRDDIKTITKKINGGYNGLNDRIEWYHKASEALKPAKREIEILPVMLPIEELPLVVEEPTLDVEEVKPVKRGRKKVEETPTAETVEE